MVCRSGPASEVGALPRQAMAWRATSRDEDSEAMLTMVARMNPMVAMVAGHEIFSSLYVQLRRVAEPVGLVSVAVCTWDDRFLPPRVPFTRSSRSAGDATINLAVFACRLWFGARGRRR